MLSGVGVPGIATRTGERLKGRGFRVGVVANAPAPSDRSVVLYARGKREAARALARRLRFRSVRPVDPGSRAAAPKAGLFVVLGADQQR